MITHLCDNTNKASGVSQVPIVEVHTSPRVTCRLPVQVLDAASVERGWAAEDPVHFVAFLDQELSKVWPILLII